MDGGGSQCKTIVLDAASSRASAFVDPRALFGLEAGRFHIVVWLFIALASAASASDSHSNIGVKECAACHSAPSPIYSALGVTRFVRLVEAKEWLEHDKHAYAYQLIRRDLPAEELRKEERKSNLLSIEITKRLNWKEGDEDFKRKCLTCHVGYKSEQPPSPMDMNFGVQCESCHGPGSEYTKTENHQQVSWRAKSPQQKTEFGLWDLTSASETAKICLSCHLGDIRQNRFITHDMYAAGHPVLPPFDLQTFLDAMPPHWESLPKKLPFERRAEYHRVHFDIAGNTDEIQTAIQDSYDKTGRSMIGGLVANDMGIELIHQAVADPHTWGDYSIYNCMGCHQELKKKSVKSQTSPRTPGRPFPADWLTLDYPFIHVSSRGTQATLLTELLTSFNSVPFGDAKQLQLLSETHLQSLQGRFNDRRKAEKQATTKQDVRQWLKHLIATRQDMLHDYWVAKQTAWMVCVAVDELVEHRELTRDSVLPTQKRLRELLRLDIHLPQRQSVLTGQKAELEMARSFDADLCKELLNDLVKRALE